VTSAERLRLFYAHEEMDRPAVIIRWWGFRNDRSYDRLYRLMTEEADRVEPWWAETLVSGPELPWVRRDPEHRGRYYPLKSAEDAERYLDLPMPRIEGDLEPYFALRRQIGDRGIVLAHLGDNPGGHFAELYGSEQFAILSVTHRELLHALMSRRQEITLRLLDYLVNRGVGPYFNIHGQEMVTPPLHGRADFYDFNVRYDTAIAEAVHAAGGRLSVHCHGRIGAVLDGFPAIGADVVHCFEGPPMGDVTPTEVKRAWGGRVSMEGNIQIADFYEQTPHAIGETTLDLIRDCFADRRGLAVSPTASPYMTGRGEACYPQYEAMVRTVRRFET
jgi:hypothetical protein